MTKRKIKRMARDKVDKSSINFYNPIDPSQFGSEDDPCFGKLHDPKAEECGLCGDEELCIMVQAQKLKSERKKLGGKFLDEIKKPPMITKIEKKKARKIIKEKCKKKKGKWVNFESLINELTPITPLHETYETLILKSVKKSKYLKLNKKKTKVKYGHKRRKRKDS